MKNKKKIIISIIVFVILIALISTGLYLYFHDENKLTSSEKRFLADNADVVQNIGILDNTNLFGKDGSGLFYDFINDFSDYYGIKTNNVTFTLGETPSGLFLSAGNTLSDDEVSFYKDHYVLVSKENEFISDFNSLSNLKIGILNDNLSYVTSYLDNSNSLSFTTYENNDALYEALESGSDINYIIVPLDSNLNTILEKNYWINYHFSDIYYYYKMNIGANNTLGSILNKYYNNWSKDEFDDYYNKHLFSLFVDSLGISQTEVDAMQSIDYTYGFVENGPYDILTSGNYGGVIAQYLKEFTEFSNTELTYVKYKNYNKFSKAITSGKVNLYFNFYNIADSFNGVHSGIGLDYSVLVSKKDSMAINSLKSLENEEVYVLENSTLYNYLSTNTKLNIKTFKNFNSLSKLIKKGKIIIMDTNAYYACGDGVFGDYSVRLSKTTNSDYQFKLSSNETFNTLFTKFIDYKDSSETINKGVYNYDKTLKNGTILGTIAKYFMYVLIIIVILILYFYRTIKRVKISKKIKKEDKLKYIDQLTSLKNRNYLNENLEGWSKNTIYPQTVIVIDLNSVQMINDTMGYEQGDIQIKAAANILVKTQLDNSDIIRTDGNEFVIYLLGYQTKQITSYIHKLNKEFKKLPYEYGASIGYSMIIDDIKSVEDAINEALEDVKKQKENKKEA